MWDTPFRDSFSFNPIETFFKPWNPYSTAVGALRAPTR